MARVLRVRVHGVGASALAGLDASLAELAARREWRLEAPWLAHAGSTALFSQLYFADAAAQEGTRHPELPGLSAAGFLSIGRDETDALACLFALRGLSERHPDAVVRVEDPDNPIAKMRQIALRGGRLPDQAPLESILVVRPIFKKLPGAVIEMYPPRALAFAFGTLEGSDPSRRDWSFRVHGMRGSAPDFLEAEAEAMRIYRGLRFLTD